MERSEGETIGPEARRAELAATRAYLEWVQAADSGQELVLAYLRGVVEFLESSVEDGFGGGVEGELLWESLCDLVVFAERDRLPQWPTRVLDLDEDDAGFLAEVELARRILRARGSPESKVDDLAWMLVMLMEPLDVFLMTRDLGAGDGAVAGWQTCLAALYGLVDDMRMEAEGLAEELGQDVDGWWDEEPCYARDPATAPQAFVALAPPEVRLAEAANLRAFVEGVDVRLWDQGVFCAACRGLVDRLQRDLAAGEVDPDWEDVLWRLLRALLPLADPQWAGKHRMIEVLGAAERRRVASLGRYCAEAGPGREGAAASRGRGMMVGVLTSALRLYGLGRCSLGLVEWEGALEAFLRWVRRDWGDRAGTGEASANLLPGAGVL